jgi:hypothetical protein
MRPVVSPGGHTPRPARVAGSAGQRTARGSGGASGPSTRSGARPGLTVRRLSREAEDGFRSPFAPGLRSGADAERLANEMAFSATRLAQLTADPPGLYAEVADSAGPIEERTWLAFLIAFLGPLDDERPFAAIEQARTSWSSGEPPRLVEVQTGPRTAYDAARGLQTIDAYRAWAQRAGSQAAGITGEPGWTPERRFARTFERLALPGLHRGARFELLSSLGRLGVYPVTAGELGLGGNDTVTVAAKRILGIGDPMLLERRAAELAEACGVPLDALDLALFNWERGTRTTMGMDPDDEPDAAVLATVEAALGI